MKIHRRGRLQLGPTLTLHALCHSVDPTGLKKVHIIKVPVQMKTQGPARCGQIILGEQAHTIPLVVKDV